MLDMKNIIEFKDSIINVNCNLYTINAKQLSEYLKNNLSNKGIDYSMYTSTVTTLNDIPQEIYEYQNFFLLKDGEEYYLLDGFRRLLLYNPPSIDVKVFIYDKYKLNNKQILILLFNLNHFKLFSNQNYYDRGFALLLKTIFDINIVKYSLIFDYYLTSSENNIELFDCTPKNGDLKNDIIKNRIINDHFIDDMRFIEDLVNSDLIIDKIFGSLTYMYRYKNKNILFESKTFINICSNDEILQDLYVKFRKLKDKNGERARNIMNNIIDTYHNVFKLIIGENIEKTYSEYLNETKGYISNFKKDKKYIKFSNILNHNKRRDILRKINSFYKEYDKSPIIKVIIYPHKDLSKEFLLPNVYDFKYVGNKNDTFNFVSIDGNYIIQGTKSISAFHYYDSYHQISGIHDNKIQNIEAFVCFE